jgi:hypothetical protein
MTITFGVHNGKTVTKVPLSYLWWCMAHASDSGSTEGVLQLASYALNKYAIMCSRPGDLVDRKTGVTVHSQSKGSTAAVMKEAPTAAIPSSDEDDDSAADIQGALTILSSAQPEQLIALAHQMAAVETPDRDLVIQARILQATWHIRNSL